MKKTIIDYTMIHETYTDGDSENVLLQIFQSDNPTSQIQHILENNPSWSLLYHLSPLRTNLLQWYSFDKTANLLEVGAGCGALTGLFCEKVQHVTAIELSKVRAEIIAERYKDRNNCTIFAGNLHNIPITTKYKYVTCIGVLEYAGIFTNTPHPYKDFLSTLKSYLQPEGCLILAIENKYGLKYWSGAPEDHTGRIFDSLEGYPSFSHVNTFSKNELRSLLMSVGFLQVDFYYPLPDYKLPTEIFSDMYPPNKKHMPRPGIFPSKDYQHSREYFFNEPLVVQQIIQDGYFDIFSNSFLIFAS